MRAAALAFFVILPLPSLLLIILAFLSQIFGQPAAYQSLIQQITAIAGPAIANIIGQLLEAGKTPFTSAFATITTVGFTIGGAIGAFSVLQDTMNEIWEITPAKENSFIKRIRRKIIPFSLILTLGFGVLALTAITTVLLGLLAYSLNPLTSGAILILNATRIGLSFALSTLLFSIIYKLMPDVEIKWREVWLAAVITSLVFTVTNYVIGTVLQVFPITSVTGVAGSVMILLLWLFLITQFVLYGAAFSRAYVEKMRTHLFRQQEVGSSDQQAECVDLSVMLQESGPKIGKDYTRKLAARFKDMEIEFKDWNYTLEKNGADYNVETNLKLAVKHKKET